MNMSMVDFMSMVDMASIIILVVTIVFKDYKDMRQKNLRSKSRKWVEIHKHAVLFMKDVTLL
jgi:hypothetical protein